MRVIGIGDSVIDRYPQRGMQYPGGNSANFCVYAAMLGARPSYLGVFGGDGHAELIRGALAAHGVDLSHTRLSAHPSNICEITITDGNREILDPTDRDLFRAAPIWLEAEDLRFIAEHRLVHTSLYAHIDEQLPRIRETGALLAYDYSNFWDWERLENTGPHVDIGFFSFESLDRPADRERMREIHARGCRLVVATAGAQGACAYNGRRFFTKPPYNLGREPVDTLGAGDAFLTGFAVAYARGVLAEQRLDHRALQERQERDREDYRDSLLAYCLSSGNLLAGMVCGMESAFGHGVPYSHDTQTPNSEERER